MPRLNIILTFGAVLTGLNAMPALAQEASGDKVNQVIIYGDDACQPSSADEIVVCNRLPESDRYRVPEIFRSDPNSPVNEAWGQRVLAMERVGRFGTDSCSPAGLGGFTGCTGQLIAGAYAEKKAADKADWSKLIAAEREKRLAGIDDAAERIEEAIKEEDRRMAERAAKAEEAEAAGGAPADGDPDAEPLPMPN